MGASILPVAIVTAFWGVVGIVLPFLIPEGQSRGVIQVVLMLTAACCWLFWLICYMGQMNPLIGPKMTNATLLMISKYWDQQA